MKKILSFIFIAAALCGCDQNGTKIGIEDNRPKTEQALIKEINIADSTYKAQSNEITQKEAYEKSKKSISQLITKDLNAKAENWEAKVHKIELDVNDDILVDVMIAKEMQYAEKFPEYSSIMLKSRISDNEKLKNLVKPLQKGDEVILSGTFSLEYKDANGNIFLNSYSIDGGNDHDKISNPAFIFNLTDIKKK